MTQNFNIQTQPHRPKRPRFGASMATVLALLAGAILSLVLISGDTVQATSFNPVATASLADPTPGANSDLTTTLTLLEPDSNFGFLTTFTPPEFFVAADLDVDNGTSALFLKSQATLGLINGPCAPAGLAPEFNMMDATADINGPTVGFNDTDDPGSLGEIFEDDDGDTIPNGAQMYPDFLINTFKDTNGQTIKPHARLYGQTNVSTVDVSLNFVIFPPGTTFVSPTNGNVLRTDPALGFPSITILQNLGDPTAVPEPIPITDFCTPLRTTNTTFGMAGGKPYRANPTADGTYNFVLFASSIPDADDDGFENSFDTCPYDVNVDGDPRKEFNPEGDRVDVEGAGEGIDSACDPDPGTGQVGVGICGLGKGDDFLAGDCDADNYSNRQDNCPLVANGPQQDNQRDIDGDTIGDACDKNNGAIDGHVHTLCVVSPVTVGTGGQAPAQDQYICTVNVVALDLNRNGIPDMDEGGQPTPTPVPTPGDADGDTVLDADDNCVNTPNASQSDFDSDGTGDACDDSDGDGFMDIVDQCVNSPAGATVDEVGCTAEQAQEDDDGDGVKNIDDKCPNTAAGATVDASGCTAEQEEEQEEASGDGDTEVASAVTNPSDTDSPIGDPATGVGALAPIASSIPAWAAIVSALGGAGLLGSLGAIASRILRRRR